MKIIYNSDLYAFIENNRKYIIDCLINNEIDPQPNEIENCAIDLLQDEYDNLLSCIKEYDAKNSFDYIMVVGSLGLWNGRRPIKAKTNTLYNAFTRCMSYDNQLIYFKNKANTLTIEDNHHDGTNVYRLYKVVNGKKCAIKYNDLLECY